MIGLFIVGISLTLLMLILVVPIIIRLDTVENVFEIRLGGLARSSLATDQTGPVIQVWLPFYHFQLHPFAKKRSRKRKGERKEEKTLTSESRKWTKKILNTIRSFRIRFFEITIDTDDYVLNAQLIPISYFLSRRNVFLSINFREMTYCKFEVRNTLWRLGLAFLELKKY